MKPLLALLTAALFSVGAAACGGASKGTGSSSQSSNATASSQTSANNSYNDRTESSILASDHANAAETRTIAVVVKGYYAALAAGDGMKACSMLYSKIAESVAEDYGQPSGPSFLRGGKTCPAIIKLLSKHFHARLADPIEVTTVHARANNALALIGSKTLPASTVPLEREGGVWKLAALSGDVQP